MNDFLNSPWFSALCIILGLTYLLYQRKEDAKNSKDFFWFVNVAARLFRWFGFNFYRYCYCL